MKTFKAEGKRCMVLKIKSPDCPLGEETCCSEYVKTKLVIHQCEFYCGTETYPGIVGIHCSFRGTDGD